MLLSRSIYLSCIFLFSLSWACNAHAQFFFIIPIPKGSADVDKIDANLNQRRHAMCAALHDIAIDPDLSGKRENTWRGEISQTAASTMSNFTQFRELKLRYARQWQLQSKNSYQAGVDYSNNLIKACNFVDLPSNKEEYDNYKLIISREPDASQILDRIRDAEPLNEISNIDNIPKLKPSEYNNLRPSIIRIEIDKKGIPVSCDLESRSSIKALDDIACETVLRNVKFNPAFSGFYTVKDSILYNLDWRRIYANSTPNRDEYRPANGTSNSTIRSGQDNTAPRDEILDTALNRCRSIGFREGSDSFKSCVSDQIKLISK